MALLRVLLTVAAFIFFSVAAGQERLYFSLPAEEKEAAYHVFESINPSVDWRNLYPDDLCLSGPHGLVCEISDDDDDVAHITELSFGYLSDYSDNPRCNLTNSAVVANLRSLSSFRFLRKLFFYNCFSSDSVILLPNDFWNLSSSIQELVFVNNPSLAGKLSGRIGNFTRLRRIIFTGTRISGNIPDELGTLQNLEELVLSRNGLHGNIPVEIGNLKKLHILDLNGNKFTGSIPVEIGRLTELLKLDFSSNRFNGSVPVQLNRLGKLEFLDLSYNNLTGGVPSALSEMVGLREVYLSGNPFGGKLPEIWENLTGIVGLSMSNIGLVGKIPRSMVVFLENLCFLSLENNSLEGTLSEEFRKLEITAGEINLQNNLLEGRIPFSAGFVVRLGSKLKLSGNRNLCVGEDFVVPSQDRGRGSFGNISFCKETSVVYRATLPYSTSNSSKKIITSLKSLVLRLCFLVVLFFS